MQPELESILDRAEELLKDLETECESCLKSQCVSERAKNLTHEVLDKLRIALDHVMNRAWEKFVTPTLSEKDKKRARVYFPITDDLDSFHSTLGRGSMASLDKINPDLYRFLKKYQPFSSGENRWLTVLANVVADGKHIRLTPQKRTETRRMKVSGRGKQVSWDPSSVKFGAGVSVLGAPIDPSTQRIVPTPDVSEEVEIWVSFILGDYGVNALGFCREACPKARTLIEEMISVFEL
jgi:hypothetical protein